MDKSKQVYDLIKNVPAGKVTTYGEIGRALGINPRQVGRILHHNPDPEKYPCHRVVKSDGKIATGYAFGGQDKQAQKLMKEGIKIGNGKIIDFERCLYENASVIASHRGYERRGNLSVNRLLRRASSQ